MNLKPISAQEAKDITDEELFSRISGDNLELKDWNPPSSWAYLGIFDDELIGYFMLHKENDNMLSIHINILKDHRKKGSDAMNSFLEVFKNEFREEIQKLTCRIPVVYPEVYHFALKFGFEDEGLCKRSIMKNGELVDQHILGLERSKL